MPRILNPHDRRALLLGAICLLGLAGVFRGIPIWRALRADARAAAAETIAQAYELEATLASFGEAMDTLESRSAQLSAIGPALLAGEAPAAAGANAEALLTELARESLVRLDAVNMRVDTTKVQQLPLVTIELQATADITGLTAFLHGLERGPTRLAVRRLAVRPGGVEASPDQSERLAVHLTIEGVALVRAQAGAP